MTETPKDREATSSPSLIFYSPTYVAAAHGFDTTRKAGWVADSLRAHPIDGAVLVEPSPLTPDALAVVHDRAYVNAVRTGQPATLAASSGLTWDVGMWNAVCASNGGAVAAVLEAWRSRAHTGSLSSGLHHASAASGAAFCTFNGLALAAHAVLAAGATHVLILDLDAHCGGGTYDIVHEWPGVVQLDIAVSEVDDYTPSPADRSTLDFVTQADRYLPTLRTRLVALTGIDFGVVIYNAGMDAHEGCAIGGLAGVTDAILAEREQIVFDWAQAQGVPVAFVLAGGYARGALQQDALVGLHRLTVAATALGNAKATLTVESIRDLADPQRQGERS